MDKIIDFRQQIDALDTQIMALLDQRFEITKTIAKEKNKHNLLTLDLSRESQILEKTKHTINALEIRVLYTTIFKLSRDLQDDIRTSR